MCCCMVAGGTQNGTQNGKSNVVGREQCGNILMGSILELAIMDARCAEQQQGCWPTLACAGLHALVMQHQPTTLGFAQHVGRGVCGDAAAAL